MKCIAVTSGKGGTGKSCVAAYTGVALAKAGFKTLLVELGDTYKALDLITGTADKIVYDITDVFDRRCDVGKAIVQTAGHSALYLLPAGLVPATTPHPDFEGLLDSLEGRYEYVIVDGVDFTSIDPRAFDMILQVVTPDTLCIRACAQQAADFYAAGVKNLRLVINSVPAKVLPMQNVRDFDDLIDQVGVQLIAVIPESPKLRHCANNALALDEESITVKIFDNLAARLSGKRRPLLVR